MKSLPTKKYIDAITQHSHTLADVYFKFTKSNQNACLKSSVVHQKLSNAAPQSARHIRMQLRVWAEGITPLRRGTPNNGVYSGVYSGGLRLAAHLPPHSGGLLWGSTLGVYSGGLLSGHRFSVSQRTYLSLDKNIEDLNPKGCLGGTKFVTPK